VILSLVYYGNHLLRSRSKEVIEITQEIKQLVDDMIETMDANNGVGLAAIQIGKPLRIFVIRPVIEKEDKDTYLGNAEVYINPKITNPSTETEILPEGCLSIPGEHADVERPLSIHVEASDFKW